MALQAALLLIIGWLPGAALFRAPVLDRNRREALEAEERVFWSVILSLAISLGVVIALAIVQRYTFQRLLFADSLIAGTCVIIFRTGLLMPGARRVKLAAVIPLVLVALGLWRFFPPAEYIIGGKDPGVYVNEGIQIAQRGALVISDQVVASVPTPARELFFPRYYDLEGNPHGDYYSNRFMGFFLTDPDRGTVVGQFPHLYPASIAIGYGIDGLTGARRTTGVWAILGLLAVYFTGRRAFGGAAAGAATALLAVQVVQIWFSRYPNAEIVMQTLLFAALLANARAHVDGLRFFAPVAGALLGLLLFLRLDSGLGIAAVVAAGCLGVFAGQSLHRSFWMTLGAVSLLAAAYLFGPMRAYWYLYGVFLSDLAAWQYVAIVIGVLAVVVIPGLARRVPSVAGSIREHAPMILGTLVGLSALYALFVREPAGRLAAHDAYAFRTFANLYFTVPGVLAAVLGFWLLAREKFWTDPALFLTIAVFGASVFYKIRIVPEHFWMARRFLPVILPGALLLLCGVAFATATGAKWSKILRWVTGGTLVLLLGMTYLRVSRPIIHHTEYEGLIPKVEALAERFAAADLLIVESRNAGGDVHTLATPLAYIYARNVLLLASPKPDTAMLAGFIDWARAHYARVYFLGGAGTALLSPRYSMRPVATERFSFPEFETRGDGLPRVIMRKDLEFGIYEFVDAQPKDPAGSFDLDVGTNDDLHVLRFYAREQTDGRTFRWTQRASYISVSPFPAGATRATFDMHDGGRPPAAPPARVEVFLQNERLGSVELKPGGFQSYMLPIPPDLADRLAEAGNPVEVRLMSTTWNPGAVIGTADDRELGVMLDHVTIK